MTNEKRAALEAALSAKQGEQALQDVSDPVPSVNAQERDPFIEAAAKLNAELMAKNFQKDERISELEVEKDAWQGRYYAADGQREKYMELMDANAKELDIAMDLLRHAETEMRYAGWEKRLSDNPGRADVYEAIKEFLK